MKINIITVLLFFLLAAFCDAKCPANEHVITRKCCNKSCEVANLPKNAISLTMFFISFIEHHFQERCKWPCAKVEPRCHCNRTFFRHKNGKCVPKAQC
uniref:TIL domain-containing protein n=1 Tax=Panagrolaimus sp. ES5 TaxID=591445 RepID=A0AC34GPK1_9BILA